MERLGKKGLRLAISWPHAPDAQEQGTGLRRYTRLHINVNMPGSAPNKLVGRERLGVALELGR